MASNSSRLASRSLGKSILSIVLGAITVIVTSLATDQLMHSLDIYPPWGEPMNDTGDNLLALAYRTMYGVLGSYVTAKVAPHSPWKHVWIGATIGFVLSTLGAVAAIQQVERTKGPDAPAMQVAAAQQVSAADPDREKSVRFRRGIDIAMNLLGG